MSTWIRTSIKSHPSFALASSDRESGVITLSRQLGARNVQAKIRKRPDGSYDTIIYRRAAADVSSEPVERSTHSSRALGKFHALMALALLAGVR